MHPDDKFMLVIAFFASLTIGFLCANLGIFIGGLSPIVAFFAIYYLYKKLTRWHHMKEVERRRE